MKPLRFYTGPKKGFEFVSEGRTFVDFVAPSKLFLPFLGFGNTPIFLECTDRGF
jgi:hypothetical protein